jgi:hypothetical protein
MAYDQMADGGLDYFPYRFGRSRLLFRGPRRKLEGPYVAVLGGSETYGKFVPDPFPARLEALIDLPVLNFGCPHAGVSLFAEEDTLLAACAQAEVTVLQITGASNMSNRLYTVHPRRNDRFLKASAGLRALYPDVDFTEFNFTRHLLSRLAQTSDTAFAAVREELKSAWTHRMRTLVRKVSGDVVLLWMSSRSPDDPDDLTPGIAPLFVDRAMLEALRDDVAGIVEVVASEAARDEPLEAKVFSPLEAPAAADAPGPVFHAEVAGALAGALAPLLNGERRGRSSRAAPFGEDIGGAVRAFR